MTKPNGYKHGLGTRIFTSGQVATICGVAPRTVSKWMSKGLIKGYRIPGSTDRRFTREAVIAFMKESGLPLGTLESDGWHKVLLIGCEPLLLRRLVDLLPGRDDFRLESSSSTFEAGMLAEAFHPDSIVIDLAMGRSEGLQIAANLRRDERYAEALIVALAGEDETMPLALLTVNFSDVLRKPFDPALLAERIRQHFCPAVSNGTMATYRSGGKGRKKR